ncbi:MAG: hypothetical protein HC912_05570 [Saprospiraceae bacterium]|nr:hypothetical protein [Saprospiraceae bacterium]
MHTTLVGNNATVRVLLIGKTLRFDTILNLVKSEKGNWQIISDMPQVAAL